MYCFLETSAARMYSRSIPEASATSRPTYFFLLKNRLISNAELMAMTRNRRIDSLSIGGQSSSNVQAIGEPMVRKKILNFMARIVLAVISFFGAVKVKKLQLYQDSAGRPASFQALKPPSRWATLSYPICCRVAAASAERPPEAQCSMIFLLLSNSGLW